MRLADYLRENGLSDADFATQIGVTRQSVHNYRSGRSVPQRQVILKIYEATKGKVGPLDWYGHINAA